jgi:hypothetical protein
MLLKSRSGASLPIRLYHRFYCRVETKKTPTRRRVKYWEIVYFLAVGLGSRSRLCFLDSPLFGRFVKSLAVAVTVIEVRLHRNGWKVCIGKSDNGVLFLASKLVEIGRNPARLTGVQFD